METTDQLYQQYKGTSIPSFDGDSANNGQCEQWYLMLRTKRDGLPVISGNAIDRWYDQETDHYSYIPYTAGVYPVKDDYVVWGPAVGSNAGHIDVVAQNGTPIGFIGYDSNWSDSKILQTIQHNYEFGILGYIRVRENEMPISVDQLYELIRGITRREPTQAEVTNQNYLNNPGLAIDTFWNNGGKDLYQNDTPPKPAGTTKLAPGIYEVN